MVLTAYVEKEADNAFQTILKAAKEVGKNRKSFRNMLEEFVPRVGYQAPKKPKILDLGCGKCYEAHVLSSYFGNLPEGYSSKDVLVVGVDISQEEIESAIRGHSDIIADPVTKVKTRWPGFEFKYGDARRLRELVDNDFDIVVAKHPNVDEMPENWQTIFKETKNVTKPESLLIATSFSDMEHETLEQQVRNADYKVILSTSNPFAIRLPNKEVSIDRNVLFARQKQYVRASNC